MTHDEILAIALKALKGSGGGGGTSNYNDLENQPKINGVTLIGNKTSSDLDIFDASELIALEFDDTQAYAVGDVVIHEQGLYQFISAHTANDPWDSTEVTATTVDELLNLRYETITISQADYNLLTPAEQNDPNKVYYVYDAQGGNTVVIDDTTTASDTVWSSQKTSQAIASASGAVIDDTTTALDKVWSSNKVSTELANKVTVVSGKGLSENDYTDADKTIVDGVTSALSTKVDKVNGKGLSTEDYTTAEKTKLSGIATGAQVNVIESISVNGTTISPDANKKVAITVITNAVDDLVNYYKKTETYTKTEVDNLISAISSMSFEVVSVLPTTNIRTDVIYLVPSSDPQTSNVKDEYINLDGTTSGWELIGSTAIDLSGYVTTSDLNTALASYVQSSSLGTAAYKNIPASGNASATQVVMGNDSRLTDARNAADVSAWAKASTKPTYTASEVGAVATTAVGAANGVAPLNSSVKIEDSYINDLTTAQINALKALTDD